MAVTQENIEEKFRYLEQLMTTVQSNVNLTITVLGIAVGIAGIALFLIAQSQVSAGIEKGIRKTQKKIEALIMEQRDILHVSGSTSVSVEHGNLMEVYGLEGFSKYNFISLSIINQHGRVCDYHSLNIVNKNGNRGLDVKIADYDPKRDGTLLFYSVVWRNDNSYEEMLKRIKEEKIMV